MEVLHVLLVSKVQTIEEKSIDIYSSWGFSVLASATGPSIQYSFDVANSVRANMSLIFDTNLGTYVNSTI